MATCSHVVCCCVVSVEAYVAALPALSALTGHRAAQEGGEEMGQEIQMDEYEGGVWPPRLPRLAEPLRGS